MMGPFFKKIKPSGQLVMVALLLLLVADLILLAFITRKPLCVETSLISEIEWISSEGAKSLLFSCESKNPPTPEKVVIERHEELQRRLGQLENLLKTQFVPVLPLKLQVHEGGASMLQIASDRIVISEELLFNKKWIFERAYLKSWLQQMQKGSGLGLLRLDIMSYFLMWNLGVRDIFDENWQNILKQWPSLATTWSGYCASPIMDEAYLSLCIAPSFTKKAELFTPLTLGFWMSLKLWQSFQALSVSEQMSFFTALPLFITELSKAEDIPLSDMTLAELDQFARKEAEVWKQPLEKINFASLGSTFNLKLAGDLDTSSENLGKVDLFLKKNNEWSTQELQDLQNLAFQELSYRVLAENQEGIWSFPWLAPINSKAIPSVRSQNLIYITCELPSVHDILDLQEHAEKVYVVQNCINEPIKIIYSGLLHRGLQFFSLDNKDIKFVYINIEALRFLIKRDNSLKDKKLGFFSQGNDRKNYLAEKANWVSALWNQRYRAYEVQATVDVVEWFKLPENTWPDFYDPKQ